MLLPFNCTSIYPTKVLSYIAKVYRYVRRYLPEAMYRIYPIFTFESTGYDILSYHKKLVCFKTCNHDDLRNSLKKKKVDYESTFEGTKALFIVQVISHVALDKLTYFALASTLN